MSFSSPVKNYHSDTYDTINPSLPALSSKGKNVLITGAGSGIGREIALSFARSSPDNIALLGRRVEALEKTQELVAKSYPTVKVHTYSADITDLSALQNAFSSFASAINGPIHTLIANAGFHPGVGTVTDFPTDSLAFSLTANVIGTANTLQAFTAHLPTDKDDTGYKARVIHVSSGVTHINFPQASAYSVAKTAAAKIVEFYALETPDVFVLSYHPGIVETEMSIKGAGLNANTNVKLPADFTVWAASPEAAFLGSGRLLWAHWDVNELKEIFGKYKNGGVKDGFEILGGLPVHKNFTLGLLAWA